MQSCPSRTPPHTRCCCPFAPCRADLLLVGPGWGDPPAVTGAGSCAGARPLAQALFLGSQIHTWNWDRWNSSDMAQPGAPHCIQALFQELHNMAVPAGIWLFFNHLSFTFLHHCKGQSLKPTVKNLTFPFFYGMILKLFPFFPPPL